MTGTGLTEEEIQRQYDIGQAFFALPHEEKAQPRYKCDFASGNCEYLFVMLQFPDLCVPEFSRMYHFETRSR